MSRFLDKAFYEAQQQHRKTQSKRKRRVITQQQEVNNPVEEIIKAFDSKEYLKVLRLPLPDIDELGNPVWSIDKDQISKYYRQMSLLVHPDKNPGECARHAFQLLNRAYKMLLDDVQRVSESLNLNVLKDVVLQRVILNEACEVAKKEKEKREAKATVDEIIKINSEKIQQKRKLSKAQHETFNSEIVRQMQERQLQKQLKRERMASSCHADTAMRAVSKSDDALGDEHVSEGNLPVDKNIQEELEDTDIGKKVSSSIKTKSKPEKRKLKFLI